MNDIKSRASRKVAVLGPIPRDQIVTHAGERFHEYGCVLYTAVALSALLDDGDTIVPISRVRRQDEGPVKQMALGRLAGVPARPPGRRPADRLSDVGTYGPEYALRRWVTVKAGHVPTSVFAPRPPDRGGAGNEVKRRRQGAGDYDPRRSQMTSATTRPAGSTGGRHAAGRGYGLVFFAAILLLVAGFFNMIYGIAAIANSHVFVANAHYVFGDLRAWGWVTLIISVLMLAASGGILAGNQLARWFAVAVVALNAIDMMFFVQAYPFWALAIIAIDVVALYGLCAYGGRQNMEAV